MNDAPARSTMRLHASRTALLVAMAMATACARSPEPAFYALSARHGGPFSTRPLIIELRRPTLPPYLDRSYLVHRVSAEELALDGGARWGAPLQELVVQALAEDLSARLPNCFVVSEASAMAIDADIRVDLALLRFEVGGDGLGEFSATFALRPARDEQGPELRHYDFKLAGGASAPKIAATLSEALARLSDEVARGIARMPRAGVPPQ